MTPAHGTRSRYNSLTAKCRCTECRAANAAYLRENKRIHRERQRAKAKART